VFLATGQIGARPVWHGWPLFPILRFSGEFVLVLVAARFCVLRRLGGWLVVSPELGVVLVDVIYCSLGFYGGIIQLSVVCQYAGG